MLALQTAAIKKANQKTVEGYRNEQQVEIFGHLFGKSAINFYHTCQWWKNTLMKWKDLKNNNK